MVGRYFGDSFPDMVSFFAGDRDLSLQELEEIQQRLQEGYKAKLEKAKAGKIEKTVK